LKEPEKLFPHTGRGRSSVPVGEFGRLILGASRSWLLTSAKAEPSGVWAMPSGPRRLPGLALVEPRTAPGPTALTEAERLVVTALSVRLPLSRGELSTEIGAGGAGCGTGRGAMLPPGGDSAIAPLGWGKLGLLRLLALAAGPSGWGGLEGGVLILESCCLWLSAEAS